MMKKRILSLLLASVMLLGLIPALALSTGAAESAELDNKTLAADYLAATKGEHPSILFTEDDLPTLRNKVKNGLSKTAYAALETMANNYKNLSSTPYRFEGSHISGRALQQHLTTLAFYGYMKGKIDGRVYLEKAKAILLSATEQATLDACYTDNEELAIGDFATALAIGYDWLYDYMTEYERAKVKSRLLEIGEWIYIASTTGKAPTVCGKNPKPQWAEENPTRAAWNWNTVVHTGMTLISMVTGEHPEWMERGLDRIEMYYQYSKNSAGMPQEGLSYTGYGMRIPVVIDATLEKHVNVSMIDRYEDLEKFLDYFTWAQLPKIGSSAINTNQSAGLGNISVSYYLANRYGSEEGLWAVLAGFSVLNGSMGQLDKIWLGDAFDLPQLILFEDQSLKPKVPDDSGMFNFDGQEVLFRTGFSETDSFGLSLASVRVGADYWQIWHHPDTGSVTFHAFDHSFLIDQGAHKKDVSDHNGIIWGEYGPIDTTNAKLSAAYALAEGVYVAEVDSTTAYRSDLDARSANRTVIYADGNCPYVFIFDTAKLRTAVSGTINWYTRATNQVTKTDHGLRITAPNNAICDVYMFDVTGEGSMSIGAAGTGAFTAKTGTAAGKVMSVGTLFASAASADKAPAVTGAYDENGILTVTVTYKDADGKEQTDTIVISDRGISFEGTGRASIEEPTTETDSETVTETTTEETTAIPTDSETDTDLTEITTNPVETDSESQPEPETEKPAESGCASALGLSTVATAVTVGACGVVTLRRRKND